MVNKEYLKGYIDGFMNTAEGYNAEYGSCNGYHWNVPNKEEEKEIIKNITKEVKQRKWKVRKLN